MLRDVTVLANLFCIFAIIPPLIEVDGGWVVIVSIIILNILNIMAILEKNTPGDDTSGDNAYISLWLKRRKLEEIKKIKDLSGE